MTGRFQSIREQIAKRFQKPGKSQEKDGILAGANLDTLLLDTRQHYPGLPVWERIEHPRDNYFSIQILPIHEPMHPILQPLMENLKGQMLRDGFDGYKSPTQYEQHFSHLWVAEIQRWQYHPIGLCTFLHESRDKTGQWLLTSAWLNTAQRNHQVLRNSVPYFKKWHPGFILSRDHNIMNKSLKAYPEHLRSGAAPSTLWAED